MTRTAIPIVPNQIHLWIVADADIQDAALLQRYSQWLSPTEQEQWKRFRFAVNQHQYLVTRALVRSVLSSYVPTYGEADWEFVFNQYGRPEIAHHMNKEAQLQFNVSHTSGLIVMVVCREGEIGVDIEKTTRRGETVSLAERYFSRQECSQLNELSKAHQRERFFDLWTLKESYIKARGLGLAIPLDSFSFEFVEPAKLQFDVQAKSSDRANNWQFWQVSAPSGYKLAVAHRIGEARALMDLQMTLTTPGLAPDFKPCDIIRSRLLD